MKIWAKRAATNSGMERFEEYLSASNNRRARVGVNSASVVQPYFTIEGDRLVSINGKKRDIVIPYEVAEIGRRVAHASAYIRSLVIDDNIRCIKEFAFEDCSGLKTLYIDFENIEILEKGIFKHCKSLSAADSSGRGKIGAIPESMFEGCSSLQTFEIPESVTSIGDCAFAACCKLTNIVIPNNVTHIGESAFWWCKSLESINIPSGVTRIEERTFRDCYSLKQVIIPKSVTYIGPKAFDNCKSLEEVIFQGNSIHIEEDAFDRCYSLINDPVLDNGNIGKDAFENSAGVESSVNRVNKKIFRYSLKSGVLQKIESGLFHPIADALCTPAGKAMLDAFNVPWENWDCVEFIAQELGKNLDSRIEEYLKNNSNKILTPTKVVIDVAKKLVNKIDEIKQTVKKYKPDITDEDLINVVAEAMPGIIADAYEEYMEKNSKP